MSSVIARPWLPFAWDFGLKAEECPQSQENPHGDLSLETMSIGDTVKSMAQDGTLLFSSAAKNTLFSVVQPKKLAASSMLDSPEERPLLNLTCLHFQ